MCRIENPPLLGRKIQSVRQRLKYEIPVVGAVTMMAKRGERQGVRSVVRKIEATLDRQSRVLRIVQSSLP
jgi:hypothetical protein